LGRRPPTIDFRGQRRRREHPGPRFDGPRGFRHRQFYLLSDARPSSHCAGFVQFVQLFRPVSAWVQLYLFARLHVSACVGIGVWISASSFTVASAPDTCAPGLSVSHTSAPGLSVSHAYSSGLSAFDTGEPCSSGSHNCALRSTGWNARRRSPLVPSKSLSGCVVPESPV